MWVDPRTIVLLSFIVPNYFYTSSTLGLCKIYYVHDILLCEISFYRDKTTPFVIPQKIFLICLNDILDR